MSHKSKNILLLIVAALLLLVLIASFDRKVDKHGVPRVSDAFHPKEINAKEMTPYEFARRYCTAHEANNTYNGTCAKLPVVNAGRTLQMETIAGTLLSISTYNQSPVENLPLAIRQDASEESGEVLQESVMSQSFVYPTENGFVVPTTGPLPLPSPPSGLSGN